MTHSINAGIPPGRPRHPWLQALIASPVDEVRRLLGGSATIEPYDGTDPVMATATIFAGLNYADPAVRALEAGLQAWFSRERQARQKGEAEREDCMSQSIDALSIVNLVPMEALTLSLWTEFPRWYSWTEQFDFAPNADLRSAFFRTLALTQSRLPESMHQTHIPFWLDISRRAGRDYPDAYIDLGLLGLKCLPLQPSEDTFLSNESLCITALVEWIEGRTGIWSELVRRWLALRYEYPHTDIYWKDLFLAIVDRRGRKVSENVLKAWRQNVGAPKRRERSVTELPLADLKEVTDFVADLPGLKSSEAYSRAKQLVRFREEIARKYGITEFAVKTSCRLGRAFLRNGPGSIQQRAGLALEFAMTSLRWEPRDTYGWSLWREALVALGRRDDAEIVAWESVHRFPDDAVCANELSGTLIERGQWMHAKAVLEDTVQRTGDVVAKTMLAGLLMSQRGQEDFKEAERLLKQAMADQPSDEYPRNMLALLWMRRDQDGDRARAERLLNAAADKGSPVASTILAGILLRSGTLDGWRQAKALLENTVASSGNLHARRMLSELLLRSGSSDEIKRANDLWPDSPTEEKWIETGPPDPEDAKARSPIEHGAPRRRSQERTHSQADDIGNPTMNQGARSAGSPANEAKAEEYEGPSSRKSRSFEGLDYSTTESLVEQMLSELGRTGQGRKGVVAGESRGPGIGKSGQHSSRGELRVEEAEANLEAIRMSAEAARFGFLLAHGSGEEAATAQKSLMQISSEKGFQFARFLLLSLQPDHPVEKVDAESGTFGLALLAALRSGSHDHVERLKARYPQEELICSIVDARGAQDATRLNNLVVSGRTSDPASLGPASRTFLRMSLAGGWNAHLTLGVEGRITAALGASLVVPLAA